MIEPNELRIGNIVNWQPEEDGFNFEATIEEIKRDGISIRSIAGNTTTDYSKISGIPLDPERLSRCGFVDKGPNDAAKSTWLRENIYCPSFDSFEGAFYCSDDWGAQHFAYCEYIHQLQNAVYALTGTELEIKLP